MKQRYPPIPIPVRKLGLVSTHLFVFFNIQGIGLLINCYGKTAVMLRFLLSPGKKDIQKELTEFKGDFEAHGKMGVDQPEWGDLRDIRDI